MDPKTLEIYIMDSTNGNLAISDPIFIIADGVDDLKNSAGSGVASTASGTVSGDWGISAAIPFIVEAVADDCDLLCIGEMGIGNTTVAAAIYHALYGEEASDWVGPGTGVDAEGLSRKAEVVATAVTRIGGPGADPLEILRQLGGREIAAMAGAIIAARHQHIPVLVDGYVASAAAAILHAIDPDAIGHCLFAHVSAEPAHRAVLDRVGARAVLDLGMRLGEGSGAALAVGILRAAARTHRGMATFESAGVSNKS